MDFFVHNVKKSLENCKLEKFDRFLEADVWWAFNKIDCTKEDKNAETFVITKKGSHYCFKCLEYLQNINQKQQKNFSEEFLNNLFFDFLEELERQNYSLTDFCKDFIKKIEGIQELNYKFLIPISRSQHWKNLSFEKLKVISITGDILKLSSVSCAPSHPTDDSSDVVTLAEFPMLCSASSGNFLNPGASPDFSSAIGTA